jgi:RNA polymerase sigma factor (sigma-70 family)
MPADMLVQAMRQGDERAYREFFLRFTPLLTFLARIYRVAGAERRTIVDEFLDDMALRFGRHTTPVPEAFSSYLVVAFRHRLRNMARDRDHRARLYRAVATDVAGTGESAILSASSAHSVREMCGPAWEEEHLAAGLERLALSLENELGRDERRIITWLGRRVPQREIAAWLGVSHGALRVRVSRLRARLRLAALAHVESLIDDERAQIERYLRPVGMATREPPRAATRGVMDGHADESEESGP